MDILLYVDDVSLIAETERYLQIGIQSLSEIFKVYNIKISSQVTQSKNGISGNEAVRTKTVVKVTAIDQVHRFNYLGYGILMDSTWILESISIDLIIFVV